MSRERVLFLCTHNSARSQMAEGFLRSPGLLEAWLTARGAASSHASTVR